MKSDSVLFDINENYWSVILRIILKETGMDGKNFVEEGRRQ